MLKAGNARFVSGESIHPHTDAVRLAQAGTENQGDHAYATVITCSDSRVPVELLFDETMLAEDFNSLNTYILEKGEITLDEGSFHQGPAKIIRYTGTKPK